MTQIRQRPADEAGRGDDAYRNVRAGQVDHNTFHTRLPPLAERRYLAQCHRWRLAARHIAYVRRLLAGPI